MHERNIFRNAPPNFQKLALEYKELADYVCLSVSGKPYINFKDPASLRALSTALLKKYFSIDIAIPLNRLIPTIPLRLNYVHWVEDLVGYKNLQNGVGVDIGCGASCIYSLLLWKLNRWKMITTEIDEVSLQYAQENVKNNHAECFITVVKSQCNDGIFSPAVEHYPHDTIDFSMCNPPFYSLENDYTPADRTNHRTPPQSISTASVLESYTDGGEVEFVKKMITESLHLKAKIRWYTTMLGRKASLKVLKKFLKENGVIQVVTTEFCQGRTMRWGLAWTFSGNVDLVPNKNKKAMKAKSFYLALNDIFFKQHQVIMLTSDMSSHYVSSVLWSIVKVILNELKKLQVNYDEAEHITLMNKDAYEITGYACYNTWTGQRAKRRKSQNLLKLHIDSMGSTHHLSLHEAKVTCTADTSADEKVKNDVQNEDLSASSLHGNGAKRNFYEEYHNSCEVTKKRKVEILPIVSVGQKCTFPVKLFSFSCTVALRNQFFSDESNQVMASFLCTDGNREMFHQLLLYLKNFLLAEQLHQ